MNQDMQPQMDKGGGYTNPQMPQYGFQGQDTQWGQGQVVVTQQWQPGQPGQPPPPQYGQVPPPYTQYPVVVQPGASGYVYQEPQEWSSDLCDCFSDVGICFAGWCGAYCLAEDIAASIGATPPSCCFFKAAVGTLRSEVRTRYNIKGDPGDDACTAHFCLACALCQMAREVKKQGAWRR